MSTVNSGAIYQFILKTWNDLEILLAVKCACNLYGVGKEEADYMIDRIENKQEGVEFAFDRG